MDEKSIHILENSLKFVSPTTAPSCNIVSDYSQCDLEHNLFMLWKHCLFEHEHSSMSIKSAWIHKVCEGVLEKNNDKHALYRLPPTHP